MVSVVVRLRIDGAGDEKADEENAVDAAVVADGAGGERVDARAVLRPSSYSSRSEVDVAEPVDPAEW